MTFFRRYRLRRRCRARLRDLPLPVPFDVHELCARVAARRGRPIRLLPVAGLTGVCGLWIATDTTDLICYERDTTRPHQDHIILHELSHVLCDHHPAGDHASALFPDLDPAMVRAVLGRAGYSSDEEREAETLASLIRQRASTRAGGTLHARLHDALDDDRG
ncbi:hypothetical protein [Actinophytocola sp. KF-1]